jgi:uncharacterized protein
LPEPEFKPETNLKQKGGRTMNTNLSPLGAVALWLCVIGAINWGLVAIGFNLVDAITGNMLWLERLIYGLVGLSGIILAIEAVVRSTGRTQVHSTADSRTDL